MDLRTNASASDRPTARVRGLSAWTMAFPLAVLAMAPFLPVVDNGFVNLDDHANFLDNPHYRGLGRPQIAWAWTTDWLGVYQPLAWMLFEVQYAAFGFDSRGYHLTSLVLHALSGVALYSLTLALVGRACPDLRASNPTGVVLSSGLAVALFVVHPLRVEIVAWASCQPYLPCAALAVLAVRAYLGAAGAAPAHRAAGLTAAWVLFALSLLFKAPAVALPAVLLVLDYFPLGRLGGGPGRWYGPPARRVWAEKVPFFALSLVFAALAVQAKRSTGSVVTLGQRGVLSRAAQSCYGTCFYLAKTVWPTGLYAYYSMPNQFEWRAPTYLACAALVAGGSVAAFLVRHKHPGLLTAWLAYLAILTPTCGLISIGNVIAADRYSYLATMTAVPLLAASVARLTWPSRGWTPATLGVSMAGLCLAAVLAGSSWTLCRTWRDTVTLASHALNQGGRDPEIYLGLGWGLEQRADLAGAEATYLEALRRDPLHVNAMIRLGLIRLRQGRYDNAVALLTEAVRLQPRSPEAHNSLGRALGARGRLDEAIVEFALALRMRPTFGEARSNLAVARSMARRGGP